MSTVTNKLTDSDMENKIEDESSWDDAPVLTRNDQVRITINHIRARSIAGKSNQLSVTWLKSIDEKHSRFVEGFFVQKSYRTNMHLFVECSGYLT